MFRRQSWTIVMLLVVLTSGAGLLATGCSSSSNSDGTLSKREYIERFNELQKDAATVFEQLDTATKSPQAAKSHLAAFDKLIAGVEALHPPAVWREDHEQMLRSLRTMRQSMDIISRASSRKTGAITTQVKRYTAAQRDFEAAVEHVNKTR